MADELEFAKDEDLERAKALWKENGTSITVGVVLGLSAIVGYNGWEWWIKKQGEEASTLYENLQELSLGDTSAASVVDDLQNDYGSTPYATLAALTMAKHHVENKDLNAAKTQLQWILDNGKDTGMQHIARLRLAMVMLADNDAPGVLALLSNPDGNEFSSRYYELIGDANVANGDVSAAKTAYEKSQELSDGRSVSSNLLQLKLDNLGTF